MALVPSPPQRCTGQRLPLWPRRPVPRTFCVLPITPISQPSLQLRRVQRCDFWSDLRIGSCTDVKKVVECASPRALKLRH